MLSDHALNGFLKQFLDDQSSGKRRSLAEYQALFPGHEDVIAARYADYESHDRDGGPSADVGPPGPHRPLRDPRRSRPRRSGNRLSRTDERLHRRVAVKVLTGLGSLTKDRVARFMREAAVASRLSHPGIATVYEIGTDAGIPYIAMQYVEGETLARKIAVAKEDQAARTPPSEIVRVVEAVARALHAAHEAGVIHRDVKPGNILITASGDPVIVDFGLAHDADGDLAAITRTGEFFGTPAYMSPEQLTTQKPAPDRRTDVWSLGATLFEWLTLRRPFDAPTRDGLYQAILTKSAPDARDIDDPSPKTSLWSWRPRSKRTATAGIRPRSTSRRISVACGCASPSSRSRSGKSCACGGGRSAIARSRPRSPGSSWSFWPGSRSPSFCSARRPRPSRTTTASATLRGCRRSSRKWTICGPRLPTASRP